MAYSVVLCEVLWNNLLSNVSGAATVPSFKTYILILIDVCFCTGFCFIIL